MLVIAYVGEGDVNQGLCRLDIELVVINSLITLVVTILLILTF